MVKVKASELRDKDRESLLKQLDDFRKELSELRVAQVTQQGGSSKLSQIKVVRKNIARVLTVYNQTQRNHLRRLYRNKKWVPTDLRQKKTRAIRRRLTPAQAKKLTVRAEKKQKYFPQRKYALRQE